MKNETRNDEAVSPVIATILMVAITVVLAGVLYVWAANLAESNTDGNLDLYVFSGNDAPDRTLDDGYNRQGRCYCNHDPRQRPWLGIYHH